MSNPGQAVLTIGGTIVGAYFGNPALGYTLGSMAGQAFFPTDLGTVSGPRLNDTNIQVSTVGSPIAIVYGTYALSGNVIWSSGIIEAVSKKKQGGKGGPTQTVKTYTYSANVAVGVCEGEMAAIMRIWADAALIYDARPQQDDESDEDYDSRVIANSKLMAKTEVYLGDAAQLPDPTIESYEGAGKISAFRDLCYVVFADFQLANYGNRIPNFRFEVASKAVIGTACVEQYSAPVIHDWLVTDAQNPDPRNPLNLHEYRIYNGIADTFSTAGKTESVNWTQFYNFHNAPGSGRNNNPLVQDLICWSLVDGDNQQEPIAPWDFTNNYGAVDLHLWYAAAHPASSETHPQNVGGDLTTLVGDLTLNELSYHSGSTLAGIVNHGLYYRGTTGFPSFNNPSTGPYSYPGLGLGVGESITGWNDESLVVRRLPSPPDAGDGDPWVLTTGTVKLLMDYDPASLSSGVNYTSRSVTFGGTTHSYKHLYYPLETHAFPSDAHYNDQVWWEARYAESVAADRMPSGLTYGNQYPEVVNSYYGRTYCSDTVEIPEGSTTLGVIVADVCRRCGLDASQINVSDLTEQVDGYVLGRVMTGRDAISPLRSFGFFDCVESASVLRWPTRGKSAVATLVDNDLAAHVGEDAKQTAMTVSRAQEVEMPRRLRVHYAQTAFNYESGEQSASRLAAGLEEVRDVELAVAMSDAKAAQIADVVLYELWVSRNSYTFALPLEFLTLEPGDAITVPVEGRQERLRIISSDFSLAAVLQVSAVRDDDGNYVSYAVGAAAGGAGTGGSAITTSGTADMVLLDLPLLRDADDDAGYYVAVASTGGTGSFPGAVVYRSPDGGLTYEAVAEVLSEASIGTVDVALEAGPSTIIDEGNTLHVSTDAELESIAEASLLAGLNAAAIGADGRWEVIQFRDVSVDTSGVYTLTGLLRGRRGTEWAIGLSQIGDQFVLLDGAVERVSLNLAGVGAVRAHKAVLVGGTPEDVTPENFTGNAVALKPFSPTGVSGVRDTGDLTITWQRRGRIGQELPSGTDIPLSETSEAYEIDVMDGPSVARTLTAASGTVTYSSSQQTIDFGSPQSSIVVRIYQLSSSVGRGYPAEITL
jgi:hypothetical protein